MIYFIGILVTVLCYETFHKNIFKAKLFRVALFLAFKSSILVGGEEDHPNIDDVWSFCYSKVWKTRLLSPTF